MSDTISLQDPMVIIAGIKKFGLASDGSDIRDLTAAVDRLQKQLDTANKRNEELQSTCWKMAGSKLNWREYVRDREELVSQLAKASAMRSTIEDIVSVYEWCCVDPVDRGYSSLDTEISRAKHLLSKTDD